MIPLPDPLHAAVVHFPIVLILLGTVAAVVAVATRRWNLPTWAAVLLALGALGAAVGVMTGKDEGELVATAGAIEHLLDRHEAWAERTRALAGAAAVLAVVAAATLRRVAVSRAVATVTAVVALIASWCVFQTGHYGGQLVYRHGAGVNTVSPGPGAAPPAESKPSHVDDD